MTSGALVVAALDAIATVIWYSMLAVLPAEGGADGRCRRRVAGCRCDVEGDEATVGDGDPVRVPGQVGEHSAGSAERPLGIDHPLGPAQCGKVGF